MPTRSTALVALLIALLTAFIYAQTSSFSFVNWDDRLYITTNAHVLSGISLENFRWAWTRVGHGSVWSPLLWISFQLDVWAGLGSGGMHIENAVLHGVSALLMFLLVARLSGRPMLAAVVALLWCVHPLTVESVAWATERKNTLSQALFLASLLAYAGHCKRAAWWRYAAAVGLGAMAMLVKPATVVLPLLAMVMGHLFYGRGWRRLAVEQAPLLVLAVVTGVLTIIAEHVGGSLAKPGSALLAGQALATYLRQAVWPGEMYHVYRGEGESVWMALAGGLAAVALVWAAVACRVRRPLVTFGIAWFLATVVLVLGYPRLVGEAVHADRFVYLPLAGILLAAAAALPGRLVPMLALAVLPFAVLSHTQTAVWRNTETVLTHAAAGNPYDPVVVQNRMEGVPAADAIPMVREAIALSPSRDQKDAAALHFILANLQVEIGDEPGAQDTLRHVMAQGQPDSRMYRGVLEFAGRFAMPERDRELARLAALKR